MTTGKKGVYCLVGKLVEKETNLTTRKLQKHSFTDTMKHILSGSKLATFVEFWQARKREREREEESESEREKERERERERGGREQEKEREKERVREK